MLARDIARVLRESVGAEYFAANRADETSLFPITPLEKTAKLLRRSAGRSYCRHLKRGQIWKLRDDERSGRVCVKLSIGVNESPFRNR